VAGAVALICSLLLEGFKFRYGKAEALGITATAEQYQSQGYPASSRRRPLWDRDLLRDRSMGPCSSPEVFPLLCYLWPCQGVNVFVFQGQLDFGL
jgi:hypothetical protein